MVATVLPEYPEPTRRRFARTVLRETLRMRRGESILVETWSGTLPWAESFVLEARILGARPMLVVEDEETYWKSLEEAPAANLGQVGTHDWAALKASNAHMYFWGPLDTAREESLPLSVQTRIRANDHEWFRLVEKFGVRSVRWDFGRTSELWAKRYGVDLATWRKELVEGAAVDPRSLQKDGQRVAEAFRRGRELRITHRNGTDLSLRLVGRRPKVDDGVIDEADLRAGSVFTVVPSGVTTVAVDETYAEGKFIAGEGAGLLMAQEADEALVGGRWTFKGGRLVDYQFEKGGEAFRKVFNAKGPGKDRPGLVAVGLNPNTASIPLLFDQQLGTISVSIGRNTQAGGVTRTPHFTAYESIRDATLEVDGKLVVEDGKLVGPT